jgi:glycosyltransferase involved in cell wall biosynthesis
VTVKVGVDLLFIRPGQVGGSEEYSVRGLTALADRAPADLDLTLFVLEDFPEAHPELVERVPTEVLGISGRPRGMRVLAESTWLARRTRALELDLVHFAGGTMPAVRPTPGVLTIHDLQPLEMPENFSPIKRRFIEVVVPRAARAAALVLTPSETARESVIDLLDLPREKVRAAVHGIEPVEDPLVSPQREAELRRQYDLPGPFFLYPAIPYPHKSHDTLVTAIGVMRHQEALLLFTGAEGPAEQVIWGEADAMGVRERIRRPGRVPRADLDDLYGIAAALTFPSRYEGFGNPALEAMSRGCAVLAADATSLPEVVGDAGVLLGPFVEEWATAMDRILDEPSHADALRRAGRARATRFSWDTTAAALEAAYRDAVAGGRGDT